jgi:hypothetical protein
VRPHGRDFHAQHFFRAPASDTQASRLPHAPVAISWWRSYLWVVRMIPADCLTTRAGSVPSHRHSTARFAASGDGPRNPGAQRGLWPRRHRLCGGATRALFFSPKSGDPSAPESTVRCIGTAGAWPAAPGPGCPLLLPGTSGCSGAGRSGGVGSLQQDVVRFQQEVGFGARPEGASRGRNTLRNLEVCSVRPRRKIRAFKLQGGRRCPARGPSARDEPEPEPPCASFPSSAARC